MGEISELFGSVAERGTLVGLGGTFIELPERGIDVPYNTFYFAMIK